MRSPWFYETRLKNGLLLEEGAELSILELESIYGKGTSIAEVCGIWKCQEEKL